MKIIVIPPLSYSRHVLWKLEKALIVPTPERGHEFHHLPCPPFKERQLPSDLQLVDKTSRAKVHCYGGIYYVT